MIVLLVVMLDLIAKHIIAKDYGIWIPHRMKVLPKYDGYSLETQIDRKFLDSIEFRLNMDIGVHEPDPK